MVEPNRNIARERAVIIVPSVSAFISFLVGITICVTMLKSKTKLKVRKDELATILFRGVDIYVGHMNRYTRLLLLHVSCSLHLTFMLAKNSYRRIIFAMTTYDILLAFGTMMAPFRSNSMEWQEDSISPPWGSIGNHTSAVVLTAIMIFGEFSI